MSFLAPGFLFASLTVAAAIVAVHFIVRRQPRAAILPTARFVPDTRTTTVAPAKRPSDLLLMLLRVLLILAAGAGLAKPVFKPSRGAQARVILVDVSRSVRDSMAIRDSVRALRRSQDAVVLFDSSARPVVENVADTLERLAATSKRGNLSAALIAALRAGSSLRDRADSLELVIVSPFAREEFDAATDTIRALWPGRARLVVAGRSTEDTAGSVGKLAISTDASDALAVTVGIARSGSTNSALIDRGVPRGSREGARPPRSSNNVLIEWPASTRPRFAVPRTVVDTVGGVVAGDARVVAAFARQWSFPPDSLRGAEVMARWVDGDPAAVESVEGTGCTRSVAIPVTAVGDLVIRHEFVRLVSTLSGPCDWRRALIPAGPAAVAKLAGKGGFAPREAFQPLTDTRSDLASWLFALALAAAIVELFVRRRRKRQKVLAVAGKSSASPEVRAA
jgi:hypothetical protein